MPDTLQALLLFAVFIVPGFLLQRGYLRSRAHGAIETDLHALAGAVVWSLAVLAVAWWFGGEQVLKWAEADNLGHHLNATYRLALAVLLIPYPVGLVGGVAIGALAQWFQAIRDEKVPDSKGWRLAFSALDTFGFFSAPTVWDGIWSRFLNRRIYLRVRTKSGQDIVGAFEHGSWVGVSPEPRQIYMSTVYREDPPGSHNWQPVPRTKGVFLDATEIESIEFAG